MNHPELDRIRGDLAKAKERVAEMQNGVRLPPTAETASAGAPLAWDTARTTKVLMDNGALRWENQFNARVADIARLEMELVIAMIPIWGPAEIIERMEGQ